MYTIRLTDAQGNETATFTHLDSNWQREQLWMSVGFDLMTFTSASRERFASELWYALETLMVSPEYYESLHGRDVYSAVLHFLDALYVETEKDLEGFVEVQW